MIDASVTLPCCLPGEDSELTVPLLRRLGTARALAPGVWALEVTNALLTAQRLGRVTPATTTQALAFLGCLPVTLCHVQAHAALGGLFYIADQQRLTTYDASYLELAMRTGLPLATLDHSLQAAAARVGVATWEFE